MKNPAMNIRVPIEPKKFAETINETYCHQVEIPFHKPVKAIFEEPYFLVCVQLFSDLFKLAFLASIDIPASAIDAMFYHFIPVLQSAVKVMGLMPEVILAVPLYILLVSRLTKVEPFSSSLILGHILPLLSF